jgi:hypothetical protein
VAPALGGAVIAGLLATVAPVAQAETWHEPDDLRDVATFRHDPTPEPCGSDSVGGAPDDRRGDIRTLRVDHSTWGVNLRLSLRDVRRHDTRIGYSFHLRVPGGTYFVSVRGAAPRRPVVTYFGEDPRIVESVSTDGCISSSLASKSRDCLGLTAVIDARREVVEVSVPATCLKDPKWVKVGAQVAAQRSVTAAGGYTYYVDQWGAPGQRVSGYLPPFGPKVRSSARNLPSDVS